MSEEKNGMQACSFHCQNTSWNNASLNNVVMSKTTCNLKSQWCFCAYSNLPVLCSGLERRPCPNHCNYLSYLKREGLGHFLLLKQPLCMSRYKKNGVCRHCFWYCVQKDLIFWMKLDVLPPFASVCVCDSKQQNTIKVHYDWNSKSYLLNLNVLWRGNMTQIKFY